MNISKYIKDFATILKNRKQVVLELWVIYGNRIQFLIVLSQYFIVSSDHRFIFSRKRIEEEAQVVLIGHNTLPDYQQTLDV